MPRTVPRAIGLLLWPVLIVTTVGIATASGNGPEPPVAPQMQRGFVPGAYEAPAAVSSELTHLGRSGPGLPSRAPETVVFSEIATPSPPVFEGPPRAHIQGEIVQSGGDRDTWDAMMAIVSADVPERPAHNPANEFEVPGVPVTKSLGGLETSFEGLANTGWIPPDVGLAVGPDRLLESTNSGFAIFDKAGAVLVGYTTFDTFFDSVKPAGWSGYMFGPRSHYSGSHDQFLLLALGLDQAKGASFLFLAVSQTADPGGAWWLYRIDTNFAGFTPDAWLDYAGLGVDDWGVYLTGNYFLWTGGFQYSTLISLGPAVLSGGAVSGWQFVDLRWPDDSLADSLQPALPMSVAGGQETFFVNSHSAFGSQLLVWTLTGDRTDSPTLTRAAVDVMPYSAIGENIDQPGPAPDLDGGDARIMNAVYSQRRVYTTLTNDTNGDASSSGVFLAKINVDSNAVEQNFTSDGGISSYRFYPAVAIGDPASASPPVSLFYSWLHTEGLFDASGAVTTFATVGGGHADIAFGLSSYTALDDSGSNRWGDYSAAAFDWSRESVWGAVEYAGEGNTWRTRIVELVPASRIFADGFESGGIDVWTATVN